MGTHHCSGELHEVGWHCLIRGLDGECMHLLSLKVQLQLTGNHLSLGRYGIILVHGEDEQQA